MGPLSPDSMASQSLAFKSASPPFRSSVFAKEKLNRESIQKVESDILEMLSRRPCTIDDIRASLGISLEKIEKILSKALDDNEIEERKRPDATFYFATTQRDD